MPNYRSALELSEKILDRNVAWISAADSKVAPNLAVSTAMLGTLAALAPKTTAWTVLSAVCASLAALLLVGALVSLVLVVLPRLQGPKGSLIFFEGISGMERETYIDALVRATDEELFRDAASQCHRNAEIAQAKYRFVRMAMILLFFSVAPWLGAIGLLYAQRS